MGLPHGHVLGRPYARDRGANVEPADCSKELVDRPLVGEIRPRELAADLVGDRLRPLVSAVVMHDDLRTLRREYTCAR